MPNWCEGNIRFRGKKEDILNLLRNEIKFCTRTKVTDEPVEHDVIVGIDLDGYEFGYDLSIGPPSELEDAAGWYWINETRRAFLDQDACVKIYPADFFDLSDELWIAVFEGFKQAWAIRPEDFCEMSRKYHVDIRIFGWEKGCCFSQDVEILNGEVTIDNTVSYKDDWEWDCPMPFLGG